MKSLPERPILGPVILPALVFVMAAAPARSDTVRLINGDTLTGIVVKQYDAGLDLQVDDQGFVSLSSSSVAAVKRQSDEENQALARRWRSLREEATKKKRSEERLALEQRMKGLVLYKGQWVAPEEAEKRRAEKEAASSYVPGHAQVFMTHEAEPQPFHFRNGKVVYSR